MHSYPPHWHNDYRLGAGAHGASGPYTAGYLKGSPSSVDNVEVPAVESTWSAEAKPDASLLPPTGRRKRPTPVLSARTKKALVPGGLTYLFEEDMLVILPGVPESSHCSVDPSALSGSLASWPDGDLFQYRIVQHQPEGPRAPTSDWRNASRQTWNGETQWCFALPTGKMNVQVRCIGEDGDEETASAPSKGMAFRVRGTRVGHTALLLQCSESRL
jgi:hypothetical protein